MQLCRWKTATVWLALPALGGAIACSNSSSAPLPARNTTASLGPNRPPVFRLANRIELAEEQSLELVVDVIDPDGDPLRVFVDQLPAGARWLEQDRRLSFRPDFIQGGHTYHTRFIATDGQHRTRHDLALAVHDTIRPPRPKITSVTRHGNHLLVNLTQQTDSFLDSPEYAGRRIIAKVTIPEGASAKHRVPVRLALHGFGAGPGGQGNAREIVVHPYDPMNSYWWGYADSLRRRCILPGARPHRHGAGEDPRPDTGQSRPAARRRHLAHKRRRREHALFRRRPYCRAEGGRVPNYTQRRALHLLEWVLTTYAGADANRVYVAGGSMGGAGAKTLGLLYARHFCYVRAWIGQTIPRNHRPSRRRQLARLWGAPKDHLRAPSGMDVWDYMDLTRVLAQSPEARNQFIFARHGRNDSVIHFGAVVQPSPLTGRSFYQALQQQRVAHYVVWDEGSHTRADRLLGYLWFDRAWHPVHDPVSFLRRDLILPAFSHSSADQDPSDGKGNGKRRWHPERGFAGYSATPGSSGWGGDPAGARNRFLRWDGRKIVETHQRVAIPLRVSAGPGRRAPLLGYPTRGDRVDHPLPFIVDVTLRRQQRFFCLPGERLHWRFGQQQGTVHATADGTVTILRLPITTHWQTLHVRRLDLPRPGRRRK